MTIGSRHLAAGIFVLVCLLGSPLQSRADPPSGKVCEHEGDGTPSCVCKHPHGEIDLRPLSFNNNTARFVGIQGPSYPYDYNPCYTFSDDSVCGDSYICQGNQYTVGASGTEKIYITEDGTVIAYYSAPGDNGDVREGRVTLTCKQSLTDVTDAVITTTGDSKITLQYDFELSSCYVCPGGCKSGGGGDISGYIGLIIIMLVLITIVLYFIIGAVIMKVHFKKEGSDIIPNKNLWFGLPLLIRDGFKFTLSPCVRKFNKYEDL